jgi:hypothetical protein
MREAMRSIAARTPAYAPIQTLRERRRAHSEPKWVAKTGRSNKFSMQRALIRSNHTSNSSATARAALSMMKR